MVRSGMPPVLYSSPKARHKCGRHKSHVPERCPENLSFTKHEESYAASTVSCCASSFGVGSKSPLALSSLGYQELPFVWLEDGISLIIAYNAKSFFCPLPSFLHVDFHSRCKISKNFQRSCSFLWPHHQWRISLTSTRPTWMHFPRALLKFPA